MRAMHDLFIALTNLKAHASISAMKCMWMARLMSMLVVAAPLMRGMAKIVEKRRHA